MGYETDYNAQLMRNKRRRRWLGTAAVFLVILGSISAGLLLHLGLRGEKDRNPSAPSDSVLTQNESTQASDGTAPAETQPVTEPATEQLLVPPEEVSPVQTLLDSMSLEEKICQLFMVVPEALSETAPVTAAPENLVDRLAQYPVGGIVLFSQNLIDARQCQALISGYQEASRISLLVGVDEEGGAVSRLGSNFNMGVTHFPPMGQIGSAQDTDRAYQVGSTLGHELKELGFNMNFAPVADVNSNPDNPVIGSRAFSSDPVQAAQMVAACVKGFEEAGMISCLKHFPGHGDTATDSHKNAAVSEKALEQLQAAELLPFRSGLEAGAPVVMAGHITLPNVSEDGLPASLSGTLVTQLLRETLGFNGVVITDAMNMAAITGQYGPGEAAVLALQAGCDLILMPPDLSAAVQAVQKALDDGSLSVTRIDESVSRILSLKLEYGIWSPN